MLTLVFIERCGQIVKANGFYAMITQHAFMFLSSYEKLREKLLQKTTVNMAHLGARAFDEIGGEVVQTTAFVNYNSHIKDYKGIYARLVDTAGENEKKEMFLSGDCRHTAKQENFSKIPGAPVAYWVSENFVRAFEHTKVLDYVLARNGMKTGSNEEFVRLWWEVSKKTISFDTHFYKNAIDSQKKWFPYNKGGEFRKWYGNNEYIVNWENGGQKVIGSAKQDKRNVQDYPIELKFKPLVTWSLITSSNPSFRYKECCINDIAGMSFWDTTNSDMLYYLLGLCNCKIAVLVLKTIAPTINFQAGDISRIPVLCDDSIKNNVDFIVKENIALSKTDWDSFETSWDFKRHPLI